MILATTSYMGLRESGLFIVFVTVCLIARSAKSNGRSWVWWLFYAWVIWPIAILNYIVLRVRGKWQITDDSEVRHFWN